MHTVTVATTGSVLACAGVPISALSLADAVSKVVWLAQAPLRTGIDVHLCNAYTLALADAEPQFQQLLQRSSMNLPDGMSVVWANRVLHREQDPPRERVYGPDLFRGVFEAGQDVGLKHYLLGSTQEVLDALVANLQVEYPQAVVVGAESPPFRELTAEERVAQRERIEASGAEIVWVGLGTPKQDVECARLAGEMDKVFVAVGAAFDFVAGTKAQAPVWMQKRGLEWTHRLATEPTRLWRRYLFGNARFLKAALLNRTSLNALEPR